MTDRDWTPLAVILLVGIGVFVALAYSCHGVPAPAAAQTDGSREPTCIAVVESDLPGAFQHPTFVDCVQATDTWHGAKLIETHPASFRHFFWHSGPVSAIFQVDIVETDGGPRHWANPEACRTIHPTDTVESGHAGAYWAMGYNIVVASGQSCAAYGVPECEGGFCR